MKPIHYAVFGFVLLAASLLACGGGFFFGIKYAYSRAERQLLETDNAKVLVAAQELPMGTVLNSPETQLKLVAFLPGSEPARHFSHIDALRGKMLARTITQNTPVTENDLSFVSDLFKPAPLGKRAVTIKYNLERGVGGLVLPGSRIDLIATVPEPEDSKKTISKVILQDFLVLAVNVAPGGPPPDEGIVSSPATMTLAVTVEEAEKLLASMQQGQICVALRRPVK